MKTSHANLFVAIAIPIALCGAVLVQAWLFRRNTSATFDETFYLSCALQAAQDGDLVGRLSSEGVAPLPVAFCYLLPALWAERQDRPDPWQGSMLDPPLIAAARAWNAVGTGIPLVLTVYVWLVRRRGIGAGGLGAGLVAFSPSILAHVSLATTDAWFAATTVPALAVLAWYQARPSNWRLICVAAAIALAVSAKYTGILLLPVAFLAILSRALRATAGTPWRRCWLALRIAAGRLVLLVGFTIPIVWALHLFAFAGPLKTVPVSETPDSSPWVRWLGKGPVAQRIMDVAHTRLKRPAPFAGLLFQHLHNVRGHPAFLMGQRSESGWWYYFPCAFFLKSTPSELFLVAAGLVLVARLPRLPIDSDGRSQHAYRAWVATISVFSVLPLFARLNIGHRYLLILYPVLFLTVTDLLWAVAAQRWRLIVAIAVGLLAVQGCSSIAVAPEYLSYFSPLVGGASQGHEFLVDSNLDWGQDLPQLRDTLRRLKYRHVLLKYFGTALPQAYGLDVDVLESNPALPLVDYDGFAVSVTHLHGLYLSGDLFAGFRHLKPVARAGHTIVVYDLHDPAASACLKAALESMASDAPDGS